MLDDKLLDAVKKWSSDDKIQEIKDAAKELCEQLAEIYMAKNDEN